MQVEILALVYLAKKYSLTSAVTIFSLYNLFFPVYLKVIAAVAAAGCSMVFPQDCVTVSNSEVNIQGSGECH